MAESNDRGGIIRRVLYRLRRYWALLALSLFMATVSVAMSLFIPILVGRAIDRIIGPGNVDFAALGSYLLGVGVCAGVSALAQWIMSMVNDRVTFRVSRDIRNEAFTHIQSLPLRYLDGHPHAIWSVV
jgi:ATP-binding cassette subfamily B protein